MNLIKILFKTLLSSACCLLPLLLYSQTSFYQHMLTDDMAEGVDVWVADIDKDGYTDIIAGTRTGGGEVSWWENDGYQNFTQHIIADDFTSVRSVRAGDINNDDKIDVVGAAWAINAVKIWRNLGPGIFVEILVDDNLVGAHTVDIQDVNGDNHVDILASGFDNSPAMSEIVWYKNDGDLGFDRHVISTRFQQSPFIVGADMDGDLDIDVVACGEVYGEVYWWENLGNETFLEHMIDNDFPNAHTIIAKDLDLDGDFDILGAAWMSGLIAWYENTGYNQFTKHDMGTLAGPCWLDCADLDNDGDRDMVGGAQGANLYWWENNDMEFTRHTISGFTGSFSVIPAAIDNDNDTDLVAASFNNHKISWFENFFNKENILQGPESIVYDPFNDRYLVSNYHSGNIVEIDAEGNKNYFKTGFTHVAGLHIRDYNLYAATDQGVAVYNLINGLPLAVVEIEGSLLLNDITSDDDGHIYITGYYTHKIFKMNIDDYNWHVFVEDGINTPNGILYESEINSLYFLNEGIQGSPICTVSLEDSTVVPVLNTNVSGTDGLTVDDDGYLYFSSWGTGCVYKVDWQANPTISIFSSGHAGPADIYYNPVDRMMAIPNFNSNTIDFIYLAPTSAEENQKMNSSFLFLKNIAPNPFSEQVQIQYSVMKPDNIEITIWDTSGSQVWTSGEIFHPTGDYSRSWNGKDFSGIKSPSGTYILKIQSSGEKVCKKIVRY